MLEINPFSISFFVNIFSHSQDFLYFSMIPFAPQKLLSVNSSPFVYFYFNIFALVD